MKKIKRIAIGGFRRLYGVNIELRPMMVMIGANGVGKTSFMDALSLMASSARGSLNQHLSDMGGIANVLTNGMAGDFVLQAEMDVPGQPSCVYTLRLGLQGVGYIISKETLAQANDHYREPGIHIDADHGNIRFFDPYRIEFIEPDWEYNHLESALSQAPRIFPVPDEFRFGLSFVTHYHTLDVSRLAPVKLPQQMTPAVFPGENGEYLAPFLYNLRETNRGQFEAIEDSLRAAFPGFESLGFPIVAAGMVAMTWKEKAFRNPIYMNQLSEGTLRFLWLVSLLHSPFLPTITMIDEPEVSLHPELLAILADLMREASDRTQLIVATHSDRFVRFLEPGEVMVMDISEDGLASMTWADTLDLERWLSDYGLDEVWRMGRIGGRA